jgi:hypothetical protein
MNLDLGDGKQITGSSDLNLIWTQIWANKGSLGVALTPEQAMEYGLWLFQEGRRVRRRG